MFYSPARYEAVQGRRRFATVVEETPRYRAAVLQNPFLIVWAEHCIGTHTLVVEFCNFSLGYSSLDALSHLLFTTNSTHRRTESTALITDHGLPKFDIAAFRFCWTFHCSDVRFQLLDRVLRVGEWGTLLRFSYKLQGRTYFTGSLCGKPFVVVGGGCSGLI